MVSFESDYIAGAHPEIIKKLIETNLVSQPGYGADVYSASAKEKIRKAVGLPDAEAELIAGGTQTNAVVISTMLSDHEGVVSATTGHVNGHEAGAIEYTGHKVIAIPHENGKLPAASLRNYLCNFYEDESRDHMVFPGMVYISHPTEYGTLYTKRELEELSQICREYKMTLYLDGARLGYALMSENTDVTLQDIARFCDVFYIGGTKVGALCGEAVVFTKGNKPKHFLTSVKKRGALLAKGRLLGVQFDALFTDDLYYRIGKHGIDAADKLKKIFAGRGFRFYIESYTNQQFLIFDNALVKRLREKIRFEAWEKYDDDHTVVRFATSWSTTDEDLSALGSALDETAG